VDCGLRTVDCGLWTVPSGFVFALAEKSARDILALMKLLINSLLLLGLASSSLAADKVDLDYRIRKLSIKLDALQAKPDKRIPPDKLRDAKGIVLLDRTKAGIGFAYQGGSGLAMVREGKSGKWSPPAFFSATEASLGVQIGAQQSFVVVLLMNTNAIALLTEGTFKFGGDASGTAGNSSGAAEGDISAPQPLTLVYSDRGGLYGGAALKGDSLAPDVKADTAYYGQFLTTKEILFEHKVKPTPDSAALAKKFEQFCKASP
jgi:lipid-binding SYLF domain-containing protein